MINNLLTLQQSHRLTLETDSDKHECYCDSASRVCVYSESGTK